VKQPPALGEWGEGDAYVAGRRFKRVVTAGGASGRLPHKRRGKKTYQIRGNRAKRVERTDKKLLTKTEKAKGRVGQGRPNL